MRSRNVRRWAAALAVALTVTACSAQPDEGPSAERTVSPAPTPTGTITPTETPNASDTQTLAGTRPNVVVVLMDDFSMDLLPTMATARRLARRGASLDHFVVDSLCCVSRASLMTGQYPHQTGVLTNSAQSDPGEGPAGGWAAYRDYGNDARTVSLRLQKAGYTTGFVGKYLNEYEYNPGWKVPPVPPGWDQFNVLFGSAYDGWGFDSLDVVDGQVVVRHHATPSASAPAAETGWEFYSYADHPWERRNAYADPRHAAEVAALQRRLEAFDDCRSVTRNQRWPKRCQDLTGPE